MGLICLDMDNTVIHSDRSHATAYNYALTSLGRKKQNSKFICSLFGGPKMMVAEKLMLDASKKEIQNFLNIHDKFLTEKTARYARLIRGARAALKELKREHEIALLSNAKHKNINALLKATRLSSAYFDIIIGYDDVKHSKPQPDEIFKAEKLLHHKAGLMVGDSIYDILAGKKARVKTIGVLTGNYSRNALLKYKPFKIIPSIKFLPETIKKNKLL